MNKKMINFNVVSALLLCSVLFVRCLNFDISQGQLGKSFWVFFLNGDLHKSLQASTARVCHEDTRALLKAEGCWLLFRGRCGTPHNPYKPNLLMLDRQRKAVPLLCHIKHFKGSHLHCVCKPWLTVIQYNPLGLILHGRQGQAQVDDPLGGICDGK